MLNKEESRKYNIPIYTQAQMDSLRKAVIVLFFATLFFAFSLGYIVGHFDLKKLADFFR